MRVEFAGFQRRMFLTLHPGERFWVGAMLALDVKPSDEANGITCGPYVNLATTIESAEFSFLLAPEEARCLAYSLLRAVEAGEHAAGFTSDAAEPLADDARSAA
jgi:hypothetical protein